MFEHSIRVPRLYKNAAKVLQEVKEKRGSLKQMVYQSKHPNLKATYALVAETLKHFSQIDALIEQSQLLIKENRFNPWLARILITELLWNGKQIQSECKPVKTILSYYDVLEKHKLVLDSKPKQETIQKVQKPRFVRINTLAITLEEAINGFRDEGWKLMLPSNGTYDEYLSKTAVLQPDEFMIDLHIKELLLFPFNTQFYNHNAYRSGLIILQDKASCLPARLLNPPPGSVVLDMCAAPGMKTTHVAALLNNEGTVYAVEKNERRFNILNQMVEKAGATCVKTINKNVMEITADDCPNVEYILVDPSCSGSGITNRVEVDDEGTNADPVRLKKLAGFQIVVLKHALTRFPQAKRIVYSTCSIYPEENENVVRTLKDISNFKLISAKNLLNGHWKNSDSEHCDAITDKCLYTKPEKDLTNGFFIAVFERKESQETHQFDNIEKHENDLTMTDHQKKKKKKQKKEENVILDEEVLHVDGGNVVVQENIPKKQKKKMKTTEKEQMEIKEEHESDDRAPKKKHKKNKKEITEEIHTNIEKNVSDNFAIKMEYSEEPTPVVDVHKKCKSKKHDKQKGDESVKEENIEDMCEIRKDKKIKIKEEVLSESEMHEFKEKTRKSKKKKAENTEYGEHSLKEKKIKKEVM